MAIDYSVKNGVAILAWNMTSSPMNVLNDDSVPAFGEALEKAYADSDVKGMIITSTKPEFVAGADLKMILRNQGGDPAEMLKISAGLNALFRRIETNGKPVVAAINGTALGGGLEICLACHYRVALNNPKSKLGLPEVKVGLLPGAGGTQRLPRMIGMQAALPLILEGKELSPKDALGLGIVDAVAETHEEMFEKAFAWIAANPKPVKPWDEVNKKTGKIQAKDNYKVPNGAVLSPVGMQTFTLGTAMMMDKSKGNYP